MRVICYQRLKCMQTLNRVLNNSALMVFKRMKSTNGLHVQQVLIQLYIFIGACLLMFYVHESHPLPPWQANYVYLFWILWQEEGGVTPFRSWGADIFFRGKGTEIFGIFLGGELTLHATVILQILSITL